MPFFLPKLPISGTNCYSLTQVRDSRLSERRCFSMPEHLAWVREVAFPHLNTSLGRGRNSNDLREIQYVKDVLDSSFKIKDLGTLRYFLGLEITRSKSGFHLNQRKYTLNLLEDTGCLGGKVVQTPFEPFVKLQLEQGQPFFDVFYYRRLVGRLLYLTISRPDISYVIQQLSVYMSKPMDSHYKEALRVVHYLKNSPAQGLFFSANSSLTLSAFSDSDWACCLDTMKSLTGFCVFLGSYLIYWKTKKQNTVSRSSSEAEYRALGSLAC
ncbi:PREDICTED: uncharacterized protein LOC109334018 [Lupinus angustifolius]|uniref:uncharacterized protein LOC109334018 n=1 Tax=Lupinus angustifolius TaxID=3871 RepID=UPI00092FCBF3|nr:PREDICTED: uncharacterized protein LOC109334018 [Lupinus angustifolius]